MKIQPNLPHRSRFSRSLQDFGSLVFHTLINLDSRQRIGLAVMFGMTIFVILPDAMHLYSRVLAAWIAGVFCFLNIVFWMMISSDAEKTFDRAQRQEAEHWAIFLLVVCTALISIGAIALMLVDNKDLPASALTVQIALSIVSILSSWFLTHTMFALHYTSCYYHIDHSDPKLQYKGGIELPGGEQPDFLDFLYFSFTIGMTSQTSDISINTASMRRLSLGHGLVSFFFYSVIIALSVGVVGGLL
ncbi:DUF1345 domain-containing protein [Leptolyngbya sp. AN03gr2]|uniref:DUF1345 domain-containing protein n=1 Tax=unclassified Leptolyngbya TaxID=2650499 RepID=UPI003D31C243